MQGAGVIYSLSKESEIIDMSTVFNVIDSLNMLV